MKGVEPVHLQEDEDTGDRFLIYGSDSGTRVEIRYQGDQLWMSQAQIAGLFGVTVATVSRHIANVYDEGELEAEATLTKIETVRTEGGRHVSRSIEHYNLDVIISVGYRVSSRQATLFRKWATDKLVRFATQGFVIDVRRLKNPENADRIAELRDIIRDIRSDEANVYRELRSICAMCQDYDGSSGKWHEFYRNTQAKLIFAVTSHTPAEILIQRADADADNMGLTTWPNDNIRKTDVTTSKNFLASSEIRELNRLTTILLDIFEDQLDLGKLATMSEAEQLLDRQLAQLHRQVLRHGGRVKMTEAKRHAEGEYEKFKAAQKRLRQIEADRTIAELKRTQKTLPKAPRTKK